MAQTNANNSAAAVGGLIKGGATGAMAMMAEGGMVDMPDHLHGMASIYHPHVLKFAAGGDVQISPNNPDPNDKAIPNSSPLNKSDSGSSSPLGGLSKLAGGSSGGSAAGADAGASEMAMAAMAKGGKVQKPIDGEAYAKAGVPVPGKAEVKGNSLKNDKIPALLSPKEIILPRSVTMAPDAPEKAKEFVANLQKKYGQKPGKEEDDFKSALKKAISSRRSK
jgi:hypothetical protein